MKNVIFSSPPRIHHWETQIINISCWCQKVTSLQFFGCTKNSGHHSAIMYEKRKRKWKWLYARKVCRAPRRRRKNGSRILLRKEKQNEAWKIVGRAGREGREKRVTLEAVKLEEWVSGWRTGWWAGKESGRPVHRHVSVIRWQIYDWSTLLFTVCQGVAG